MSAAPPPRSLMFVPGDSPRKLARAGQSGADALILDLEDAVAPEAKAPARGHVAEYLSRARGQPTLVRVNALDSGLAAADLDAVVPCAPDGYVLPKCEGPDDLDRLAEMIAARGGAAEGRVLAIATETARALRRLMREDWRHPALTGLAWGGEDLQADLGAARNRDAAGRYLDPYRLARVQTLLAAREAGVPAYDAVFTALDDPAGLEAEARAAAADGFEGKLAIHPGQLEAINAAFSPTPEELEWARRVVAALGAAGGGVARLDGQMLDRPHLRRAEALLRRAGLAGADRP